MKKITFFVSNIFKCGGVQRVVSLIANKLINYGYDISILSLFKTNDDPFFQLNNNIKVNNIFKEPFDLRKNYFKVLKNFNEFMKNYEVDIFINAGMGHTVITYPILKKIEHIKIVSWEHQNFYFGKKFGMEWIGKRIACSKLDGVVVLTKFDLNSYNENLSNIKKIIQIYNPVDNFTHIYEYNENSKKIISCGSLTYQKGFDMLIEVAKEVFKKYTDWQWHIWGEGSDREMLENKIKEYNLQENVILKGYSNDIYEKYKDYSFYVLTSRYEGFPMVLLEAQANKLPIVAFDCKCGPREIIDNDGNGYLIENFNVEKMAYYICELIEDKEKRIKFSENAFLNKKKFEIKFISEKWIDFLKSL